MDTQSEVRAAQEMAAKCGRRVEVLGARTEVSQTFLNPDGSETLEESIEPVRVRKGGSWVSVDTTLKVGPEGIVPRAAAVPIVFSAGGDAPLARIARGDRELGMTWPGRLPVPKVIGNTATYPDVLPGVDLRVTAQAAGFSEVLVVRTREAAANPKLASLWFGLSTRGVSVRTAEGGGLVARDAKGQEVFSAPAPLMWDSSVEAPDKGATAQRAQPKGSRAEAPGAAVRDGRRLAVMPVRVENGGLTITPDQKILADPGAKLPIFIDPSWTAGISGSAWTSVWSKSPSNSFWQNASALQNGSTYGSAGAGRTEDCSGCADHIVRSLFRMDTTKVRGKQILAAEFRIEQRHAWTCSPKSNAKLWLTGGISSGTTWNKQPTWYGDQTAQTAASRKVGAAHGCLGTGTIEFNVKSMVTKAAAGKWTTLTVGLRAIDEGNKNQWKRFNHSSPKLAITYNTPPNAPGSRFSDAKDCATGTARPFVRTLTPALAGKQSDPDGDQGLTTWFYWWVSGGSRSETNKVSKAAGNNTSVAASVPSGRLTDGGTYVWQARTADAHSTGAWSATCEFTVDVTPPGAPSDVTSADYPEDSPTTPAHGGVGLAGEFEVAPPSTGASEVVGYAWSLDDSVQPSAANQVTATAAHTATIAFTPVRDGVHTMYVWAKDRAGWYTPSAVPYTFKVKAGAGPAAHWLMDEASGNATDATGHSNTAVPGGSATRTAGRSGVGQALSLNGTTGYAATSGKVMTRHPDTEAMVPVPSNGSITMTAWVRLPATGGAVRAVASYDGVNSHALRLGYNGASNRWVFRAVPNDTAGAAGSTVTGTTAGVANKWTYLAAVWDLASSQMRLYVNGTLDGSATLASAWYPHAAATSFSIGRSRTGANVFGDFWSGAIDDVRVYSYAVAATDLAVFAAPLPPTITVSGGGSVPVGGSASAVIGAGGDVNVTSYRYSIGSTALNVPATPTTAGGTVTVTLSTANAGTVDIYAVAVDGNGRQSPTYQVGRLTVVAPASLTGFVTDGEFAPLPGAVVTVESTGRSATVAADGSYTVDGFSAGTYTVRAEFGGPCGLVAVKPNVEISGETLLDLMLEPVTDGLGYTCATQNTAFSPVNETVLALTGDDAVAQVGIPFAFPFYGASYRSAWVDTNGMLSFTDPGGSHPYDGTTLPAPAEPNAVVAPFWDDLVVDAQSSVRTAATGTGEAARFTVEWRNVHRKDSTAQRLSFEVILAPDGTVTTNYDSLDNDAERGVEAAVGIEAPAGEDGFTFSRNQAALTSGRAVVFDHPEAESPIDVYDLSGTLVNASGSPVVGATVTLDPSGLTATTGAGGAWRFDDLVADSYTVTSSVGGRCRSVARAQVELASDTVRNLQLGPDYGGLGYACATGAASFVPGTTVLPLTGDDAATQVTTPFPITFHGRQYTTGWVHTNGMVSFGDVSGLPDTYANPTMPTAAAPNAVVAPFWDDFQVDAPASVLTLVQGTAPNRSFVVEWRNVGFRPSSAERVTFEVIFHEDGRIAFHYGTGMTSPTQQGGAATIGLENASGTVAALYSFHQATSLSNSSIVYTPAAAGTVSGTLTTAVTGTPVPGATVTLNPGGRTATTGADGGFQFTGLPVGEYTVGAATGDNTCAGQYAKQTLNHPGSTSDVDLSLMLDGDEFGYECTAGPQTFVPGDITEAWTGDETVWQKNPPFPVKLYGNTYTSAWISANGLVSFKDPTFFGWIGSIPSPIPSQAAEGVPNAAVYVHWDDWVVDSQARIATKVSGTAPNRQWVVEWRNVYHFEDPAARATFEVIFHENGAITFAYADITATSGLERGSGAMVGIENASGTIGFQYFFKETWLASGQGVSFTPTPPGAGTVSGTVTCQGSPVAGATVAVSGRTATTGAAGTYEFPDLPAGTYAVVATLPSGDCRGSKVAQVTVGTNTQIVADFATGVTASGAGYTLAEQAVPYTPIGGTVLPLTGDEAYGQVSLPFPVTLYEQSYSTGWVDTNGLVAFIDPGEPSSDAWPIPSPEGPEEPNAAVYPFWHDWVVDPNASIRTATTGTAPNRQFIVEWRNVHSYEDPTTRVTFQLIFDEAGGFRFAYADIDGTYLELGGGATIGIENADGTIALQYTYRQPVLRPGTGIRITPPTS